MTSLFEILTLPITLPLRIVNAVLPKKHPYVPAPPGDKRFANYMDNTRGELLRIYKWRARTLASHCTEVKGIVFLVHGYNEHLARYDHIAEALNAEGYDVFGIDHHGHGLSEGRRAYISNFDHLVEDYEKFIRHLLTNVLTPEERDLPRAILGHSMGGLIAVHVADRNPTMFNTVVLSGPLLMINPAKASPVLTRIAKVLRYVIPHVPVDSIEASAVAADPVVVGRYAKDVLNSKSGIACNTAMELICAVERVEDITRHFRLPFLIVHGQDDALCAVDGSKRFYECAPVSAESKRLVLYPGLGHEAMQEAEWEHVLGDITAWLKVHM
eukprot:PhM_4_TR1404/c0_g1_i1/m.70351/K01054/MGLL; acylglycerol lipase